MGYFGYPKLIHSTYFICDGEHNFGDDFWPD